MTSIGRNRGIQKVCVQNRDVTFVTSNLLLKTHFFSDDDGAAKAATTIKDKTMAKRIFDRRSQFKFH